LLPVHLTRKTCRPHASVAANPWNGTWHLPICIPIVLEWLEYSDRLRQSSAACRAAQDGLGTLSCPGRNPYVVSPMSPQRPERSQQHGNSSRLTGITELLGGISNSRRITIAGENAGHHGRHLQTPQRQRTSNLGTGAESSDPHRTPHRGGRRAQHVGRPPASSADIGVAAHGPSYGSSYPGRTPTRRHPRRAKGL